MKISNSKYIYPLLIDGERYLLNKDPFIYAEEGVLKYWPEKIEKLSQELLWDEYISGKTEPSSEQELKFKAARFLAAEFLADDDFFIYYKQDGGGVIPQIQEITIFPAKKEILEEEREVI